jgi:hypothetical protein
MNDQLSNQTSIFGLRLWVVLGVSVGVVIVLLLFLISVWLAFKRNNKSKTIKPSIPDDSKEIQEIKLDLVPPQPDPFHEPDPLSSSSEQQQQRNNQLHPEEETTPLSYKRIQFEIGKNHRISYPEQRGGSVIKSSNSREHSGESRPLDQVSTVIPQVSHLGWGHWYTLRELEDATNAFAPENVIGEGGYGIVYHGILKDNTNIAIKNLLNNRFFSFIFFLFFEMIFYLHLSC